MYLFKTFRNCNVNKSQFGNRNYNNYKEHDNYFYVPTEMYIHRQKFVPPIVMQEYEMSKEETNNWFNHLYTSANSNNE